jgi:hypothetical protein
VTVVGSPVMNDVVKKHEATRPDEFRVPFEVLFHTGVGMVAVDEEPSMTLS